MKYHLYLIVPLLYLGFFDLFQKVTGKEIYAFTPSNLDPNRTLPNLANLTMPSPRQNDQTSIELLLIICSNLLYKAHANLYTKEFHICNGFSSRKS